MVDDDEGADLRRLADFVADPRERLDVELKQWLDLSDRRVTGKVARHLMALANHGGGWLQFGFVESDDGQFAHEIEHGCPDEATYSSDAINSVVRRYAQPAFPCETFWQPCDQCPGPHALIRVPGGHRVPIVCRRGGPEPNPDPRRGAVYGRLPGPRSEALEDPDDWHRLLDACLRERRDELLETIRSAISLLGAQELRDVLGAVAGSEDELGEWAAASKDRLDDRVSSAEGPSPYAHGSWSVAYRVVPAASLSVPALRQLLLQVVGNETGWPVWWWPTAGDARDPVAMSDGIECWMHGGPAFGDPAHADYWRASVRGQLYLQRGFDEDAVAQLSPQHRNIAPGSMLDPIITVWRIGECLLHAERLANQLGSDSVEVLVQWTGLAGRHIASLDRLRFWNSSRTATEDDAQSHVLIETATIGSALARIVHELTAPVFALYSFLEVPEEVIATELDRLRGRGQP
jgi:hypothetical protein